MTQSNFIAGAIFIAFIVYITMKGELSLYMGYLGFGNSTAASTGNNGAVSSNQQVSQVFGTLEPIINFAGGSF